MIDDGTILPTGSKVRFYADVTLAGEPAEPSELTCTIASRAGTARFRFGSGVVKDPEPGRFHVDFRVDMLGPLVVTFQPDIDMPVEKRYTVVERDPVTRQPYATRADERELAPIAAMPRRSQATAQVRDAWRQPLMNARLKDEE